MAAPLRTTTISIPGFLGLNTTDSEVTLDEGYARVAENCIIEEGGRLGARLGWAYVAQTATPETAVDLLGMHRFVDITGTEYFGAWSDDTFYIKSGSSLNSVTYTGSNTLTAGNWQAATLNDAAYLFQSGYKPIYFNPTSGQLDDVENSTNTFTSTDGLEISNGVYVAVTNGNSVTITNSGTTATVTQAAHKLTTGDSVIITGADQTEYNGTFTITVVDVNTYTYTMSSSPSSDATGDITARSDVATVVNVGHQLSTGDSVTISGADQSEYNGTFTITVLTDDVYYYNTSTVATSDATGTVVARSKIAIVAHTGYKFATGDSITISGANESAYNGTFSVTTLGIDSYSYVMASVPTSDATGTLTASWSKGTPPEGNTVLSAYGRLWVADTPSNKTTVYWSDLLDGAEWREDVGTVGSLDISGILVNGNDDIVGLGAHNGYLIIFCKNNIIIMGDGDADKRYLAPADLQLVEVINGIGCIARDSIVNTGTDILFLSESGVRSLGRTIQEKSQPVRDISRNVRDSLVNQIKRTDLSEVKAVYSDHFAFYLLAVPEDATVWCFDMRAPLPNGAARVTRWNTLDHTNYLAFDGAMYMTNTQGIAEYKGRQDNGQPYVMQYYTNYFDFQMPNVVKMAKNLAATVRSSVNQEFFVKIATDYEGRYDSHTLTVNPGQVYEYNTSDALYGLTTTTSAVSKAADTITSNVEGTAIAISAATQANPCAITATAHGLTTGDLVVFKDVGGMTELNTDTYTVTVVDTDNFTLDGIDSSAYTVYTSGGSLVPVTEEHYTVDFSTTEDALTYNTELKVWLDADTYYYTTDDGTRTRVSLYTKAVDYASEYSGSGLVDNVRIPVGGAGFVLQLGFESIINSGFLSIQQVDLFVKQGRLR